MRFKTSVTLVLMLVALLAAPSLLTQRAVAQQDGFPLVELPEGFEIERVVDGLTYPTSVVWDDQDRLYVVEAGGQFLEEPPPARVLRVADGQAEEVVDLSARGVADSVVGATWHDGAFYVTHRDAQDRTGAVSRVTPDGDVTQLFSGIVDAQSEHTLDEIRLGPDGRMYVAAGGATNSAVVGLDNAPFVERSPDLHTTACRDVVLTGQNFETPDFRTEDPDDTTLTGAFVPFGTETEPGQEIEGSAKCGSSILAFDPGDPGGTLEMYAWGFRHVIGFAWSPDGEMFASVNSYDVRGSRPVEDEAEATYRVREGAWYGWPDYSAALEPLTDAKFDVPDSLQAPVYVGDERQDKDLGFLIDHDASGLGTPDPSLVLGLHEYQSSPTKLDVAPGSWGDLAGHVFVAEWGDLAPETNPLQDELPGYRVVGIDPESGQVEPFVANAQPGPASEQDAAGKGIERPFDVKFGPDGAMYVVDYGVARVNQARVAEGQVPYEFPPETGAVWKVTPPDSGDGGNGLSDDEGTPAASAADGRTVMVDIRDFAYEPDPVEIPVGGTVTWTNRDRASHTATGRDRDVLDSGKLAQGESYDQRFDEAGTFEYRCAFHPNMKGTVVVE
ncbi:MAG: cupredoxin domain-containing protein [Chloroflexota bacterium]|nr:cupredoxin domain-containing protein [Chloroflexota bacterium]